MAIWAFGAMYDGNLDVANDFANNNVACIGWDYSDAPSIHEMLKSISVGDLVYVKSFPPGDKELRIKAIGIITNSNIHNHSALRTCINVKWLWAGSTPHIITAVNDRNNVRSNTLYREYNPEIIEIIFGLISHIFI